MKIDTILGILVGLFVLVMFFIIIKHNIKQKNRKQNNAIRKSVSNNKFITKNNNLNLVDNKSTVGGIIASQQKKQMSNIVGSKNKKPIGWISAKSYGEDAKNSDVAKYVPFGDIERSGAEKKELNKKAEKQKIIVLAVDDSITILKFISNVMIGFNYNYDVVLKESGQLALDYLNSENQKPNIMLIDLDMPVMNGEKLIEKIKENEFIKNIPIIILSSTPENAIHLFEKNLVNGILPKPFIKDDFIEQLNYLVF